MSSHLVMLQDQIDDLIAKGDHENAKKVLNVYHEAMKHQSRVMPPMHMHQSPYIDQDTLDDLLGKKAVPARPYTMEEKLAMRMGWGRIQEAVWAPEFEHVAIHYMRGSTITHIWVISKDGQSHVLEDEAGLFPSDALITKLNLLKG